MSQWTLASFRMPVIEFAHDRRQIIVPVAILPPASDREPLRLVKLHGLIDTGASSSGIRPAVATELDLPRRGKTVITTPSGDHIARLFQFRVGFYLTPGQAYPHVIAQEFIGIGSSPGDHFDVLIGMDLLGRGDLAIRRDGSGSFTFDAE